MKNIIEILDRYYQSFVNQKRDWDFFLGLADYVKYIVDTPEIDNILKSIVQKRVNDEKKLKRYEKEVIKETKQAKDKLFKIIKKHKISYESLDRAIKEYQGFEDGRIQSSRNDAEALSDTLSDIIRNLFQNGYKKLVKDFAVGHKEIPNEIGKYTFSKTLDSYYEEKEIYADKSGTELWGAWNKLVLVYLTILKGREEFKKLKKDKRDFFIAWNFTGLLGEMQKIREGNKLLGSSDFNPVIFIRENYISHASRVHNYLIQELSAKTANLNKQIAETEKLLDKLESDIKQEANKQIDYTDKVLRKACERKWDIIQRLWEKFEERSHPNQMSISIKYLTERINDIEDVKGILENYQRQDCFKSLRKGTKNFQFNDINKEILEKAYKETKETYEKFAKTYTDLSKGQKEKGTKEKKTIDLPKTFEIQVKDREIWINNYLLSKPHAVGSNLEFFEYIRSQPANIKIERKALPSQFGSSSIKEQVKNKSFIKILNALGFKGEILKAFFYKRSRNTVFYKGDEITKKDLEKSGIKIPLFLKELEVAHTKNSPE